jgi:hypothetical protein
MPDDCIADLVTATSLYAATEDGMTYNRFKFASCRPSTASATVHSADDLSAGRIQVQLAQVVETGRREFKPWYGSTPGSETDKKLPDGKKWFMAPGLKVCQISNIKFQFCTWLAHFQSTLQR